MRVVVSSYETGWDKNIEINKNDNKFLNANDTYISFHAPSKIEFKCKDNGVVEFTPMIKVGGIPKFSINYILNGSSHKCELAHKISINVSQNDNLAIITTCENNFKAWCYIVFHNISIINEIVPNKIKFNKHNHLGDSISILYGLERIGIEQNSMFIVSGGKIMGEILSVFNFSHVTYDSKYDGSFINGDEIFSRCSWENVWLERFYNAFKSFFNIYHHPTLNSINQNWVFSLREPLVDNKKQGVLIQFDSRSEGLLSKSQIRKIVSWCSKPISVIGGPDTKYYLGNDYPYLIGDLNKNIKDLLSCELFIGSDSGMAHLAGILNVPAIVIAMRPSTYTFHKYKNTVVVESDFFGCDDKSLKYNPNDIEKVLYGLNATTIDITKSFIASKIQKNCNTEIDKIVGVDLLGGVYKNLYIKWKDGSNCCVGHGDIIRKTPKQNNVIYFTPTGQQYREMCVCAIRSIMKKGDFHGRIVVFCDEIDDGIKSIEKYGCVDIIIKNFDCHPLVSRIYALDYINNTYDSILYLDCDVLVYGNINNLFCYDDVVLYMEEPWHYNKNTASGSIDTYYFSDEERSVTYGNYHPINSGHFSVSGKYKNEFFNIYKNKYESRANFSWGQDQSCLNFIVRTNMVKSKAYEKNVIGISTHLAQSDYNKYDLIHFAGHGDRLNLIRDLCEKI